MVKVALCHLALIVALPVASAFAEPQSESSALALSNRLLQSTDTAAADVSQLKTLPRKALVAEVVTWLKKPNLEANASVVAMAVPLPELFEPLLVKLKTSDHFMVVVALRLLALHDEAKQSKLEDKVLQCLESPRSGAVRSAMYDALKDRTLTKQSFNDGIHAGNGVALNSLIEHFFRTFKKLSAEEQSQRLAMMIQTMDDDQRRRVVLLTLSLPVADQRVLAHDLNASDAALVKSSELKALVRKLIATKDGA